MKAICLSLLCFISFVSCTEQKDFLCWDSNRSQAVSFSYDNLMGSVTIEDIHTFHSIRSIKTSFNSDMKSGTHFLKMEESHITLQYIQDTVYVKIQLPSGKFLKDSEKIHNREDWLNQIRYHAVYPVVWDYRFNKKSKQLSFSSFPLHKPRSSIKQKFNYSQKDNQIYPYKVKDLTNEESSAVFKLHERKYKKDYPNCDDESLSTKSFIRKILKLFLFP